MCHPGNKHTALFNDVHMAGKRTQKQDAGQEIQDQQEGFYYKKTKSVWRNHSRRINKVPDWVVGISQWIQEANWKNAETIQSSLMKRKRHTESGQNPVQKDKKYLK